MISVRNFYCTYNEAEPYALKKINVEIKRGEFVAVIGPSGGGKSTLAFSINGILPNEIEGSLYSGEILLDGIRVQSVSPSDLISVAGTVLQDPEWQLVQETVLEELTFTLENLGIPVKEIRERLCEVLKQIDIKSLLHRSTLKLSGGEKQRVAIACSLMLQPKVLVLDEPTAELDPIGKELVIKTISQLNKKWGYTVVFIDHNLDITLPFADRVVVIADGEIAEDTHPLLLYNSKKIQKVIPLPQITAIAKRLDISYETEKGTGLPLTAEDIIKYLKKPSRQDQQNTDYIKILNQSEHIKDPVLELKDVWFNYRESDDCAVKSVNLTIGSGEFTAVIGANGAGKSTLCKLITGLLRPKSGEIFIKGRPVEKYRAKDLINEAGYVFQNPDFQIFQNSVYNEIAFGLKNKKLPKEDIDKRVLETAKLLDIEQYLDTHPHFLSRGERKRVAIGGILALNPDILILDEPTIGLDACNSNKLMRYICRLWKSGHTVIILTHDMSLVARYVPRTIIMSDGKIIINDDTEAVFSDNELLKRYSLTVPPVVKLSLMLGWSRPALTADEFVSRYKNNGREKEYVRYGGIAIENL